MELLTIGFPTAFTLENVLYCFAGVFLGTLIGVLPGLGPLAAVSLLLPLTFYLDPVTALVMLAGVYYGAEYGGSTSSILLNLPGTASHAVTCLDGYPMRQQGRAGAALFLTTIASFFGGSVGILLVMFLAPAIATFAMSFGAAEYFAAVIFGLIAAATIGRGSPVKGVAMVLLGLMLGCIGMDVNTGVPRFTAGFIELFDGISIVIVAMGLFGVSEVIASAKGVASYARPQRIRLREMIPTRKDMRESLLPMIRGSGVGCVFGPLPGVGPTIGAFLSYALEKRVSKDPSRFGTGAVEGLMGPEASNNAAVQTAFIPTLSLGIPGSATMAVMLGALMIHGISPGPRLMVEYPTLFWGLIASFWIGNFLLLIINIPMIGIWVRMLQIPYRFLFPTIVALICVGVFSINNSVFDVWIVLVVGLAGYFLRELDFEPAPMLIGFILGPMLEVNLRRAMLIADGNFLAIIQRPLAGALLAAAAVLIAYLVWASFRRRRPVELGPI